ncbi:hypothetical protein EA187_06215 [Lujinxingia sediminis]|uniref:Uncharacterized protein n=1 Tax=Lujinxingia sediminis TaxID=2480984 RepID=A0ABY0CUZ1_9DELT|nr:hypothetical protein [Lujinxingia sediminis]RVU46727.1 hypothetical protein EA187_06215 [Lujinxingia sediminis]
MSLLNHRTAWLAVGFSLTLGIGCKNPTANAPPPKPTIEDALGLWAIHAYRLDEQGCIPQPAQAPLAGVEARRSTPDAEPNAEAAAEIGAEAATASPSQSLELADCSDFSSCAEPTRPEDRLTWNHDDATASASYAYASPATRGDLESWCRVGRIDSEFILDGPSARHTRQRYETLIVLEGDLECTPQLASDLGDETPCVTSEVFELVPYEPIPEANPASANEPEASLD